MCLKAENQWLKSCSPYSGRTAPGCFACARAGVGSPCKTVLYTHPPRDGSKDRWKDDIHLACTSVGTGIHLCRCVCLSVSACLVLYASVPFAAQILAISCHWTQIFAVPRTCKFICPNVPEEAENISLPLSFSFCLSQMPSG